MPIYNGFFNFPEKDTKSMLELFSNPNYRNSLGIPDYFKINQQLENFKLKTIARLVKDTLELNPESRVVVLLKRVSNTDKLSSLLKETCPDVNSVVLHGTNKNINTISGARVIISTQMLFYMLSDVMLKYDYISKFYIFLSAVASRPKTSRFENLEIKIVYNKEVHKEFKLFGRKNLYCPLYIEE